MSKIKYSGLKKGLSVFLATMMIVSLMPVYPALAAEWDPGTPTGTFSTMDELKASNHQGIVMRYTSADAVNPVPPGFVRVDFGVYKLHPVNTVSWNLKFDPAIVKAAYYASGKYFAIKPENGFSSDSNKLASFFPFAYDASVYNLDADGEPPEPCTYFFNQPVGPNGGFVTNHSVLIFPHPNTVIVPAAGAEQTGFYSLNFNTTGNSSNVKLDHYIDITRDNETQGYLDTSAFAEPVFLAYTYFKIVDTANMDKLNSAFSVYQTIPGGEHGGYASATTGAHAGTISTVAMIGFPKAAPVVTLNDTAIVVKNGGTQALIEGAGVTIAKKSGDNAFTTISGANTDANGIIRGANQTDVIKLPANVYDVTVSKTGFDTKTQSVTIVNGTTAQDVISISPVAAAQHNIIATVIDAENNNQPLKGAVLTIAGASSAATADNGVATVLNVAAASGKNLTLTAPGYETMSATLGVAEGGMLTLTGAPTGLSVSAGTALAATMKKIRTVVTMPLPIPTDSLSAPILADGGKDLKLIISKNLSGNTPSTAVLPRTVTTVANGENEKLTVAPTSGATAITAITANLKLPAGNYIISLGGNGLNTETANLNILSDGTNVLTNLGGAVTNGGKTVTGGYTVPAVVTAGVSAAANLVSGTGGKAGATLTDSGVAVSISGGTAADGGFLANNGTAQAPILKVPTTIIDPVYIIEVTENKTNSKVTSMTANVYLKNLKATAGTFGMRYDTTIFDTQTPIVPTLGAGISYITGSSGLKSPETESGYSTFSWHGTATVENAGKYLIAKYELPITTKTTVDLAIQFTDKSIYVMDYSKTGNAKSLVQSTVKDNWRMAGTTAGDYGKTSGVGSIAKHVTILPDAQMLNGGYYQVSFDAGQGVQLYDARAQMILPQYGNARIELNVKDQAGLAISGAMVNLYADEGGLFTPPAASIQSSMTDANGDAYLSVKDGATYEYSITKSTHWTYPTGTAINANDLETEKIKINVATNVVTTNNGSVDSTHVGGLVGRVMNTRTYHKTELDTTGVTNVPTIAGAVNAYNDIDYAFNLQPPTGFEWKTGQPTGSLSVKLYDAVVSGSTVDYKNGVGTALTATWSAVKNAFVITGTSIKGNPPSDLTAVTSTDLVRAGNLVVTVAEDFANNNFVKASYTVTANAGAKGTVSATEKDGTNSAYAAGYAEGTAVASIVETLSNGHQTSAKYSFAPSNGTPSKAELPQNATDGAIFAYVIDQVYVNGVPVDLTDYQRIHGYTYQFANMFGNQNIPATFCVREVANASLPSNNEGDIAPSSAPVISILVGKFGKAALTYTKDGTGTVSNGSRDCIVEINGDFSAVITPDTGYIIDKILVDGTAQTVANTASHTVSFTGLSANRHHTVLAMFKSSEPNAPSIQVAVFAGTEIGMGRIFNAGIAIYNMGATPTYNILPDGGWDKFHKQGDAKGALMLRVGKATTATDVSSKVVETAGKYTYTLDPLTADTELTANFMETARKVVGAVRFWDGAENNNGNFAKGDVANLIFTRAANSQTGTDELKLTTQTTGRNNSVGDFEIDLPSGKWTVLVQKQGYLNYTITDFVFDAATAGTYYFGGGTTIARKIAPTTGDASGDGEVVSFFDAAQVAAGMAGSSNQSKLKGDIDESSFGSTPRVTDVVDMSYVIKFYNKQAITETYAVFIGTGSASAAANK